MGAVLFWVGVGLVLALVLVAARASDRRARRRGHHLRSGGDMSSSALEQRRDTVASDGMGHLDADRSWTARSRETGTGHDHGPAGGPQAG
jgi:membrane protein implicated in regulation of membrane protease activity